MSTMWVTPALATPAMFSAVQMPPPTAIRPVTHVMSMPQVPYGAATAARKESGIQLCNPVDLSRLVPKLSCRLQIGDARFPASGCHFIYGILFIRYRLQFAIFRDLGF